MYYGLGDGRYHVFLWLPGGRRPADEAFDTPGEARAFLRGLERGSRGDRHFRYEVLTLAQYEKAVTRVRG